MVKRQGKISSYTTKAYTYMYTLIYIYPLEKSPKLLNRKAFTHKNDDVRHHRTSSVAKKVNLAKKKNLKKNVTLNYSLSYMHIPTGISLI